MRKTFRNYTQLFLCAGLMLFAASGQARAECLSYGAAPATLTGKLVRKTFPGAPNFESVAAGDQPETGFYLQLAQPVCVKGGAGDAGSEPLENVRLVQLVLQQKDYAALRPSLGNTLQLRGKLFSQMTGHHHAPLLLEYERVETGGR